MITGEVIISYPNVFVAVPNQSGVLKFGMSLLIDKTDTKTIDEIRKHIERATQKGLATIWNNKKPNFRYEPLRDGDKELASGEKDDPIYKGKFFLNASSDKAPGVVGSDAKPIIDQNILYAGCIVRGDINPFPYKNSGNCGVGWGLNNVMFIREGSRLDGRVNAEDAFAGYAAEPDDKLM